MSLYFIVILVNNYKIMDFTNKNIIGYIHVCQIGEWKRSFKMLLDSIKTSGLYENTSVIRLGILNNIGVIQQDEILNDDKFEIVYVGRSEEYEVPTLLSIRKQAEQDIIYTQRG